MGQQTGIDIAWDRPSIPNIKATGATWVARYFSNDVTKNLTPSEVQQYTAAGLGIVTVWETTATRALQGLQAGVDDAKAARAQRASVGLPDDMPIHFAVDTDTQWAQVAAYFQGVVSVLGLDLVGVYGGLQVIEGAHSYGLKYLWQTVAWSGGVWAPYATIRQPGGTTLAGGADFDTAEVPDFGQYPRPVEDDMPYTPAQLIDFARQGALAAQESQPGRDAGALADLWWLAHALNGTTTSSMSPDQVALIQSIHSAVTALNATPKPAAS
jgi:hypothetical protein